MTKKKDFKVLKGCSTHHLHGVSSPTVDNQTLFTRTSRKKQSWIAKYPCLKSIFQIPASEMVFAAFEAAPEFFRLQSGTFRAEKAGSRRAPG